MPAWLQSLAYVTARPGHWENQAARPAKWREEPDPGIRTMIKPATKFHKLKDVLWCFHIMFFPSLKVVGVPNLKAAGTGHQSPSSRWYFSVTPRSVDKGRAEFGEVGRPAILEITLWSVLLLISSGVSIVHHFNIWLWGSHDALPLSSKQLWGIGSLRPSYLLEKTQLQLDFAHCKP